MKANSEKTKQSKKATRRVLAGVLCGASVLSLVLSLVMPPISQAIANDGQAGAAEKTVAAAGSSTESTDVENTNNVDTEKQDSDDAKGNETVDDALEAASLSDDTEAEDVAEPADGDANDESAIALSADGEYFELSQSNINGVLGSDEKAGTYRLTENITYDGMVTLGPGETVIDLNGHKILHSGVANNNSNLPMFNVPNGATLTIWDSKQADDTKSEQTAEQGMLATVERNDNGMPLKLTYYVTESSVNAADNTRTIETTYKHEVNINGAIVGTAADSTMKLINVYEGGTFNLQSGVLTTTEGAKVGSLIYAENGSIVNMSGGYVCGATSMSQGAGIELGVKDDNGNGATLNLIGGVIAGNYAPNGGGVYAKDSTIEMTSGMIAGKKTSGTISGNGTFENKAGYGAGICALGSTVTISDGYITNNKYQFYQDAETSWTHKGFGCHGGGGIAAYNGGNLQISGGYITGNYSAEAGGGVYAGAWNQALSSFTFSGGTIASNVAQNSEGGGIRIGAPTMGVFNVPVGTKAYITNNNTNTTNDWGGGGVFVQGGSDGIRSASLKISNALITNNSAQGYGGGFAACPSGKTAITDTNGIAIFGNSDANGTHLSGGTNGKNEDQPSNVEGGEITEDFKSNGHKDLFLIRKSGNDEYIAAVTGQMLGGGAANWSGTIDKKTPTSIGKYEGAQAKYRIGLKSDPSAEDQKAAKGLATLYITGNISNIHGGGIMTNGDVVAGSTTQVKVYPKMKLNGTKALTGRTLKDGEFKFQLLKQGTNKQNPSFADHKLQLNGCTKVGDGVTNGSGGKFAFNLGEVYSDDSIVYYLVEDPSDNPVSGVTCDETIYKIDPKVVKDERKSHKVLDIDYTYYKVDSVQITTIAADGGTSEATVSPRTEGDVASVALTSSTTFTNAYTKYDSKGSWTPKATKVVEGGEMKEFTLEFADNENFKGNSVRTVKTDATGDTTQTLSFLNASREGIKYSLSDITKEPYTHGDSAGRGASKTFTYYVREKTDGALFSNYKYDKSVYKLDVTMTDQKDGTIKATNVTYMKGTVDSDGKWVADTNSVDHKLTDTDTPTFTNTYSTSLPLSGMSGVTLTYLAGAAVLCAAAAWMHIRRKANAKGGERRE